MSQNNLIGIIEGTLSKAYAERLKKLILQRQQDAGHTCTVEIVDLEWPELEDKSNPLVTEGDLKLKSYEEAEVLIDDGADVLAFPDITQIFWTEELQKEIEKPIARLEDALINYFKENKLNTVGLITQPSSRLHKLLKNKAEQTHAVEWAPMSDEIQAEIGEFLASQKSGEDNYESELELLRQICRQYMNEGAQAILLAVPEADKYLEALQKDGLPVLDTADIYAAYIVTHEFDEPKKSFKIGLVGGLGPAATVDLYDKIVRATPAKNDQEHFKVIIEQNPQIPDRTAYLLGGEVDPTLALYAACQKLERDGADVILIPCNTAHAFFESIAPHLHAHMINMQQTALEEIAERLGTEAIIGLLATDGTCKTGIYKNKADQMGMTLVTPDPEYQKLVMEAIYGPQGVKAGIFTGLCKEQLLEAGRHLVRDKGAKSLILGCTELPLILDESPCLDIGEGLTAVIVDPTSAVARKAVKTAQEAVKDEYSL